MDGPPRVASAKLAAESRFATVLKCDLVNSTRGKRILDLEGQLTFQRLSEQIITDVAARFHASIGKFEGDGALIVLGFPESREDAAESAIRMGFELVRAISDATILPGIRLQLRVGIATGPIAVIHHVAVAKGESIAGLTIDLAERLRTQARPDEVLISDQTRRLAGGFFHYEDLGPVQLKGFEEGVRAWRVVGPSELASRFEAQRNLTPRAQIIGREQAIARLAETWRKVRAGEGQAVCLVGDPGIGKSRLARLVLATAARDGAMTFTVHCTPSTRYTPLFPIGVELRSLAGIKPALPEAQKQQLAREFLARVLPGEDAAGSLAYLAPVFGIKVAPADETIPPSELHERSIATLDRMVMALAAERPMVLLCEDLHWADNTTAIVLARICARVASVPVMVIATTRYHDGPLSEVAGLIVEALEPLGRSEAADLVRVSAGERPLSEDLVASIAERSEGLPLLIVELTRSALETDDPAETPSPQSLVEDNVPTSLQVIVESRLTRSLQLAPIIQSASILGRECSIDLLKQMLPNQQSDIVGELQHLSQEGLLTLRNSPLDRRVRFKHAMIRDAVYNTLLASDRRRLHSMAADILVRDFSATPDGAADVVAEHFYKAGRLLEAVRVRLAESSRTAAQGAYVETEGHCRSALAIVDKVPDPSARSALEFRLLIQLGVALSGREGYSAASVEEAYRRANAVCGDGAEAKLLYPIMRGLATVNLVRGNLQQAYELSLQGLDLAERSDRCEYKIDAMSVLCYTTFYFRRLDECRYWIERCLERHRAEQGHQLVYPVPQDSATAAIALLPTVAWLQGDLHGAEQAVQTGLAHVEQLDRDFDRALLHCWIAGARLTQRRYGEAVRHSGIAVGISQQHGYREWYATGALVALLAQGAANGDPQAVAQGGAALAEFAREGIGLNASYFMWALALGHLRSGEVEMARQIIDEAVRRAQASQETRMNAEIAILQAELEPDDARAAAFLEQALISADAHGDLVTALRAAAELVIRNRAPRHAVDCARASLAILADRAAYPGQPDWVGDRLAVLRGMSKAAALQRIA